MLRVERLVVHTEVVVFSAILYTSALILASTSTCLVSKKIQNIWIFALQVFSLGQLLVVYYNVRMYDVCMYVCMYV